VPTPTDSSKTWTNQPDDVLDATNLGEFSLGKGAVAEVRKSPDGTYLLTTGGLFGSQTMRCDNADVVFKVLSLIDPNKTTALPDGATLVGE
jgi:hypothetical protein